MSETPVAQHRIPGKKLVPVLLALVLLTFLTLLVFFYDGPKGRFSDDAAGPKGSVAASIELKCGSEAFSGKCRADKLLTISLKTESTEAKYVTWALFGTPSSLLRSSPPNTPVEIILEEVPPGAYMLTAIVADAALDTRDLARRFGPPATGLDPVRGIDVVEGFAGDERKKGRLASVTRVPVVVEEAPKKTR